MNKFLSFLGFVLGVSGTWEQIKFGPGPPDTAGLLLLLGYRIR